jgi:hypothetical protein
VIPALPLAAMDWPLAMFLFFGVFGGGGMILEAFKNHNRTRLKMAELKAKQSSEGAQKEMAVLREEMAALKQQVASLRDTTTDYDLSFDTALQNMEQRVGRLEQKQQQQEHQQQRIGV